MISLKDIEQTFRCKNKVEQLRSINLSIAPGEAFGLIGTKESGKSTLLRCVNLLERPITGMVSINKQNLSLMTKKDLQRARTVLGWVEKQTHLLHSKTVFENVALPLRFAGYTREEIALQVEPLLARIGLAEKYTALPHQLTLSQKKRVALARAVVGHPAVLLCDDFTGDLDLKTTHDLLKIIKTLQIDYKLTLLLTTQNLEVVKALCDRVAVMSEGRIVEQTDTLSFVTQPQSSVGREFIRFHTRRDIPSNLRTHISLSPAKDKMPLFRFAFTGGIPAEALMTHAIEAFNLRFNILQGYTEQICKHSVQILLISIMGNPADIEAASNHFKENGLYPEVIAYVPRTA